MNDQHLGFKVFLLLGGMIVCLLIGKFVVWRMQTSIPEVAPDEEKGEPFLFKDMTAASGVDHTYRNGQEADHYTPLEEVGGGIALIDYDGDGLLDIFVTGGGYFTGKDRKTIKGHPCKLYRNMGGWRFEDVTRKVGLADGPWFYTHGAAVADYDRDGWPDLLVTGWGRVALFHNVPNGMGGRKFVEVTQQAGLNDKSWSTGAAFMDLHGDGYPDLYLCQYVDWDIQKNHPRCPLLDGRRDICPPKQFKGLNHRLYRNNGDGTFADISKQAGLNLWGKLRPVEDKFEQVEVGKGLGVVALDLNHSRRPSFYVANDTVDNFLYMNRTRRGLFGARLKLDEVAFDKGVARDGNGSPNGSSGVTAGDYTGKGWASLFVTNYEDEMHTLYRNDGNEEFFFATEQAGIQAIGQKYVGHGTSFIDLENRGWLDLVISNGHVIRHPVRAGIRQKPVLFRNRDGSRFEVVTEQGGPYFQSDHNGRGLAVGDLDNDGRTDLVISHLNEPVAILRNTGGPNGRHNHWIGIELIGRKNRDLAGARVIVEVDGRPLTRFATGGGSYLSASDTRHLFGLGKDEHIGRVTVVWPWGATQHWDGSKFRVDRYWRLVEGDAEIHGWAGRKTFLHP